MNFPMGGAKETELRKKMESLMLRKIKGGNYKLILKNYETS